MFLGGRVSIWFINKLNNKVRLSLYFDKIISVLYGFYINLEKKYFK